MQPTPPAKRLRLSTPATGPARLQQSTIDVGTTNDDQQPNVLAYFARRDEKLRNLEQQLHDAQKQLVASQQETQTAQHRVEQIQKDATRAAALHTGEIATLIAERDALLARLQNQGRAAAVATPHPPEAPSPTNEAAEQLAKVQLQLHEQQQKAAEHTHTLQRQLLEHQHAHADATAALRAQLEDALRRAHAAEQMHAVLEQRATQTMQQLEQEQQRRRDLEAAHVALEQQQVVVGSGDGADKEEQGVLIRALRGEVARLEHEVVEARRLKQYMRNVETLQSQLDGAESRATQLASRLTSAQAHAAEAQTLGEELQRWRDLAAQLLPHGSGVGDVGGGPGGVGGGARGEGGGGGDVRGGGATPEMLQSVMVELQKDVRQRAAASVQAQQACADLQGKLAAAQSSAQDAHAAQERLQLQIDSLTASHSRQECELQLLTSQRDSLQQLLTLCMEEATHIGDTGGVADAVRTPLDQLQSLQHTMQANLHAAEQRITTIEQQAARHLAAAHEWEARATGLQRRLEASERQVESLGAQVSLLERRLGRGEYDPSMTRVLHLVHNPEQRARERQYQERITDLQHDIQQLRQHLEAANTTSSSSNPPLSDALRSVLEQKIADLEKRNRRLQEVFKQQILHFREACFFLFGYRIDMAASSTSSLAGSTVRLVPGGDERRELVFRFDAQGHPRLVPNAYTQQQQLAAAVQLFLDKEDCVPAFTANLTMDLFNSREDGGVQGGGV